MFESYDLKARNPYGAKLSTRELSADGAFKAVSVAIPAGQQLADHTAPSAAMLFAIEGEVRLIAESEEFALAPGTVVQIPPGVAHRIEAAKNSHFVLVR